MSYPPPPAPIPRPTPLVPVPVVPLDPNWGRGFERKPGLVSAIGTISIVLALGTLVGCLFMLGWSVTMYALSQRPPMTFVAPALIPPTVAMEPEHLGPIEDETSGLPRAQRQAIILTLTRLKPSTSMSPKRREHLDALLAQTGRSMFPLKGDAVNTAMIRQSVTDSGVLPSSKAGQGPHFFIIGTGRVEVYDTHALFRPTGSGMVTSVSADAHKKLKMATTRAAAGGAWGMKPAPNAAQYKRMALPSMLVGLEAVLSAALAVYLLVAGVLTLRSSLSGARLHWIYVFIKLPLVLLAAAITWWLWSEFLAVQSSTPRTGIGSAAAIIALIGIVCAALYPLALIFILQSSVVREYYKNAYEDALARPR